MCFISFSMHFAPSLLKFKIIIIKIRTYFCFYVFVLLCCLHPEMPCESCLRRHLRRNYSHLIASHCTILHNNYRFMSYHKIYFIYKGIHGFFLIQILGIFRNFFYFLRKPKIDLKKKILTGRGILWQKELF